MNTLPRFFGITLAFVALTFCVKTVFCAPSETPKLPPEYSDTAKNAYSEKMKALRAAMDRQKWEAAVTLANELSQMRPREPQARFIRSLALSHQGKIEDAKNELVALTTEFPELPEPHNNLATIYAKAGNYLLARQELERAIAVAPEYAIAHANLADLYTRLAVLHYQTAADQTQDALTKKNLLTHATALSAQIASDAETPTQQSIPPAP